MLALMQKGIDFLNWRKEFYHNEPQTLNLAFWDHLNDWLFLWGCVCNSIIYETDNPNCWKYADGSRVFEQNQNFKRYPCESNDEHLKSAFVAMHRELIRLEPHYSYLFKKEKRGNK